MVHVSAGTPHQLSIPKGTMFSTLVVKITSKLSYLAGAEMKT